jgi:site-specific recombinase XerD
LKLWAQTGDINFVKEALGHSSLNATQVYTKVTQDYLKKIFKQKYDQSAVAAEA